MTDMDWLDDFGALDRALSYQPRPLGRTSTFNDRLRSFGVDQGRPRRSSGGQRQPVSWSDLASGSLAPRPQTQRPGSAAAIERVNVKYPLSSTSTYAPPPTPVSTQGDLLGSIGGAFGSVLANINLANAIPWFMERVNVLANDVAAANIPVVSQGAAGLDFALDRFIEGVDAVAQPVGAVLDAFPSWVRDQQLNDRAKLYRALASGQAPDYGIGGPVSNPLSTLNAILSAPFSAPGTLLARAAPEGPIGDIGRFLQEGGPVGAILGQNTNAMANEAAFWQQELLASADPQRRLSAEQRLGVLRDAVDLPESIKLLIERKPTATDEELARWLDEAPEGRQWSYEPGARGFIQNIGNPLTFYLAEARAGYQALGAARAAGLASSVPGVAQATIGAGKVGSGTLRLLTAMTAAGAGVTGVTTTMNAIARYAGADEAIAWFDNANRTTEFSDDPMVQLVTGFAVNPFAAAGALRKGVLTTKHGLVDIPVSAALGRKMLAVYDSESLIVDMTRRMYRLGSNEEAAAFLDEEGLREAAPDMILATALDTVIDRLPREERLAWVAAHADPVERSQAAVQRWGQQALDLIQKDPDLVAARFYTHDWQYRMSTLPFNAQAAAKIARDYRRAVERTYDLRAEQRAVVGYREYLPPQGQSLARSRMDAATVDGAVAMRDLTDLVVDLPVLRKFLGGRVRSGEETIPRAVVDTIIDDAAADWAHAAKVNPVRVATGTDPVIRPSSPTLMRDYAESMGTSIDTVKAISDFDPKNAAHADLLRRLLVDKGVVDEATAASLTPEQAWTKASDYFDDTTSPWLETGRRIEAAETQIDRLRGELARVRREPGADQADRILRLEREIREIQTLVQTAGDPIQTFASLASQAKRDLPDLHLAEMAARKVDAIERLRVIQTVNDDLATAGLTEVDLRRVVAGADGELVDAVDLAGTPPKGVADAFLAFRTANMYVIKSVKGQLTSRRQQVRELSNKGNEYVRDFEAAPGSYQWAQIASSPGFVKRLREIGDEVAFFGDMTGNQIADIVEAAGVVKGMTGASLDDIAEAWGVDRAGALRRLADLRRARGEALEGRTPASLRRTSEIKVPDDYVAQAEANRVAREVVYDAEYEAFWHPRNVAKVDEITRNPDELWPGLRAVAEADPAVMDAVRTVASAFAKPKGGMSIEGLRASVAERARVLDIVAKGGERTHSWRRGDGSQVIVSPDTRSPGRWRVTTLDAEGTPTGHYEATDFAAATREAAESALGLADTIDEAVERVFANPSLAAAVRKEVVPDGFEAPIEGMIRETTELDFLIRAEDSDAISALAAQLAEAKATPRPPTRAALRVAEQTARLATKRRSYNFRRTLSDAEARFTDAPSERIMADPANKLGLDVLSVMNHGIPGTRPASIRGVIALLADIENGNAGRMGIGPELAAEGQRVARELLEDAVRVSKRSPENVGTFSAGFFPEDELALAATIDDLLSFDVTDPLGTLQYGLKKAPKDAVVMEWAKVPGLAEELLSRRFVPFEERVWTSQTKRAVDWIFGPRTNRALVAETRSRFIERATRAGVTPETATSIWDDWAAASRSSRSPSIRRTKYGAFEIHAGDNPLYAGVQNLPNSRLQAIAHGSNDLGITGTLDRLQIAGAIGSDELAAARGVDWSTVLRESTSTIRRSLADSGVPLGRALATAYGFAAHNAVTTTFYYWFRFGLDIRYHAMNYLEAQILYLGRAGLRKGEIDEGLLGQSEGYLRNLDMDPVSNTGYPFSRDRMAWAYKTFLKEQPDALRGALRELDTSNPRLIEKALRELAETDPQLRDMLESIDGKVDPTKYLGELDAWHRRLLDNVDGTADAAIIDQEIADAMASAPHLAEVFDRLGQANKTLWDDIRATFYGNPNRSRAERFLNSYLLFWPLSYQIKSTKWFAKVLFDRMGGVQTNALGAVTYDRMAAAHNQLLTTDAEYRDWFEKHPTLVFVAQMLFPVSFEGTGVSLNPALRGLFFDRDVLKAGEIGPIYTYNRVLRPVRDELEVDVYPFLRDWFGAQGAPPA